MPNDLRLRLSDVRVLETPIDGVTFHEYADAYPMLDNAAMAELAADIAANGIIHPIVMAGNVIIDGRNRYKAACMVGASAPVVEWAGGDPLDFIIACNEARRHLTESQRAMVAARLANMREGRPAKNSANLHSNEPPPVSLADAADKLKVSRRTAAEAKKIIRDGAPELVDAVESGAVSVSAASFLATLDEQDQAEIVSRSPDEIKTAVKAIRAHVANNSGNNEWYTPAEYVEAARKVLGGFDLDPASSEVANRTVQAARIFTAEDDGLAQEWPVGRVWMNPPYAQPLIGQFSERFAAEIERGSSGIVLVNNATETRWFQTLLSVSSAVCFPAGRVRFLDPDGKPGAPLQGQAVLYAGPDADKFALAFSQFGAVLRGAA